MLILSDISHSYGPSCEERKILSSVNLHLTPGETVAVTGPSGSGKSTLLHIAGGLEPPVKGTVRLDGNDLYELTDSELSRLRLSSIGFLFQEHFLLPQCTALENILLPTLPLKKSSSAIDLARSLLRSVGLEERSGALPGQLSIGECQRVALARALVNRPRILFADEPTGSLDPERAAGMTELMLSLNRTYSTTLLVVTHNPAVASAMGRTVHLERGRLIPG